MKRQLGLAAHAWGALGRRAGRTWSLIAGLGFTVALFASVWLLSGALRAELVHARNLAPDLTVQRMVAGRPALFDAPDLQTLEALPAVRQVRGRVWGYIYLGALDANLTVVGQAAGDRAVTRLGRSGEIELAPGARAAPIGDGIWMGAAAAETLGLVLGDKLALPGSDGPDVFVVKGLFREASALRTADVVMMDEARARSLLGMGPQQSTDLAIELSQPREAPIVAEKIRRALPGRERILDRALMERSYGQSFGARSGLMMAGLLPALASLLLIAFDRLSGMGELERREIGVLRACGFLTADILAVRVWESAAIALLGSIAGLVAAYLFVFALGAPGLSQILYGYSALYPELHLTPQLDPGQALAMIALVTVPFTAVSLIPAWRAAVLDPAQTLRGLT